MSKIQGMLMEGYGSFYSVLLDHTLVEARARGRLKKEGIKLLIGDQVVLEQESGTYAIIEVLPRKNSLIRPAVANVDQIVVVVAAASPDPNFKQTDKLLCVLAHCGFDTKICINKTDLTEAESLSSVYEKAGYQVVLSSAKKEEGFTALEEVLKDKITAFAGCSGVGKSSLINLVDPHHSQTTGKVGKIARGRHTTTHASLLPLRFGGFIADTPGFSVVDLSVIEKEALDRCFLEFRPHIPNCRFIGCTHTNEPGCRVIEAVEQGAIAQSRYDSYLSFYEELRAMHKNYNSRKDS